MKYHFKRKPMKHQLSALKRALRKQHIGLLWEPGTGKSKVVVDWASVLHQQGKLDRVLIACPLSVVGVWEDAFKDDCPLKYKFHFMEKEDFKLPRKDGHLTIVVSNYDRVWRRKELIKRYDPQMVIADESHRIKKATARRSKCLRSLNGVTYRAILTGTPAPKSLLDLYSQWTFLNIRRFGSNIKNFNARYLIFGGYMGKKVVGYDPDNLPKLKKKVRLDASIKRKDQVLDLPEQLFQRVPLDLEPVAQQIYDRLSYDLYLQFKSGEVVDIKNAGVKVMRLQQVTGGFVNTSEGIRQVSSAKLDITRELLENLFYQDERVVIVARFRPELDALAEMGKRFGVRTYSIRGGVKRTDRDAYRRAFQSKSGPALMVLQVQSGGLGITLHSAANAIFYSTTFALDDYIQACDRLHRKGQTRKVIYKHLVARDTVDLDLYTALRQKKEVMSLIMGKPTRLIRYQRERKIAA